MQLVVQALQLQVGQEGTAPILQQAAQHVQAARAADDLAALLDLVALHTGAAAAAAGGGGPQVGGLGWAGWAGDVSHMQRAAPHAAVSVVHHDWSVASM
jgi:hypothetical protein